MRNISRGAHPSTVWQNKSAKQLYPLKRIQGIRAFGGCGQLVQNLRINVGKKCVRTSTASYYSVPSSLPAWINQVFYPHTYPSLSAQLSTVKTAGFTPVKSQFIPSFHSTYNNHHQFN